MKRRSESEPAGIAASAVPPARSAAVGAWSRFRLGFAACQHTLSLVMVAQTAVPDWCRAYLARRTSLSNASPLAIPGSKSTNPPPMVFAIYESHQFEQVMSYFIFGEKRALLFDTGMGISDIKKITADLTKLPVIVLNSHTHNDHVGGNWDSTPFTGWIRTSRGPTRRAHAPTRRQNSARTRFAGTLPPGFDAKAYATRPWKITAYMHDRDKFDLGARTIEVMATPGHTPDAISLIDRADGLLFTGDTYYPAPIWLFRSETDLNAYAASIRRLGLLAPQVKLVLGAHNIPVASPDVLTRLVAAFDSVRSGKVPLISDSPGKALYKVGGVSFLMRATSR